MEDRMYIRELLQKYTSTRGNFVFSMFIKSVIVWVPSEILSESIELIDFPGVNDQDAMRDNYLRVGLESVHQMIAMCERDLSSAQEVNEKIKEFGITRLLASMSRLPLELKA